MADLRLDLALSISKRSMDCSDASMSARVLSQWLYCCWLPSFLKVECLIGAVFCKPTERESPRSLKGRVWPAKLPGFHPWVGWVYYGRRTSQRCTSAAYTEEDCKVILMRD